MPPAPPPVAFDARIAQQYNEYLGPFLFEPFALDLVARLGDHPIAEALELACGTGRVTRHLREQLPQSAQLLATDLNPGMLAVAQQAVPASGIAWEVADMAALPYANDQFEVVVCQFGLMFPPNRQRALTEIHRVLKPGGQLLFNTWAPVADNGIWAIANKVVAAFLGSSPVSASQGPFSMHDEQATLRWLAEAGFCTYSATSVKKTGEATTAARAAHGFLHGLPLAQAIQQKDPALLPQVEQALAAALRQQLGDQPLHSPLRAWVFEAGK